MIDLLRNALADLVPWVRHEHRCWWKSASRPAGVRLLHEHIDAALDLDGVLVDAIAAALVADRGALRAQQVDGQPFADAALHRAVRRRLDCPAPALHELANDVEGPVAALAVYLAALWIIDGSRSSGRVWLEDLAEALLLPPVLIRQLRTGRGPLALPA